MKDTVQKLLDLADEYASAKYEQGYAKAYTNSVVVVARQALEAELVRLFTPLSDGKPMHKHEWFRTGAMAPGEHRCITCGAWMTTKRITGGAE